MASIASISKHPVNPWAAIEKGREPLEQGGTAPWLKFTLSRFSTIGAPKWSKRARNCLTMREAGLSPYPVANIFPGDSQLLGYHYYWDPFLKMQQHSLTPCL